MTKNERRRALEECEKRHQNHLLSLRRERYETCVSTPVTISCIGGWEECSLEFEDANEEPMLFFENQSGNFFMSTFSRVLQAEYHTNRSFAENSEVSLNEYYDFLGLPAVDGGDRKGWDMDSGIYWVDFQHLKRYNTKGEKYYAIVPSFAPDDLTSLYFDQKM